MILNQLPKQNVVNNALSSTTLRISEDAKDQALLVDLQISKLYRDKVKSVIREYISNAKDANIAAGKSDVPVKIYLPSPDKLLFEVSDDGLGMSPEEIDRFFCSVGASSKRDTNTQIGSFGLGLKCGFAYIKQHGYQFNITTVSNCVKYFYVAHYDEQNFPRVSLLGSEETDDVGTTISIPVHEGDWADFVSKATYLLSYWKFHLKYEIVSGHNLNLDLGKVFYECPEFTIHEICERRFGFIAWSSSSATVSIEGLPYAYPGTFYGFLVVANIGIGVLDLIPSREDLEGTKNNDTILKPIFEKADQIIIDHFQKIVDSFSSEFELWEFVRNIKQNSEMWNFQIVPKLKFKGNEINYSDFQKAIVERDDWIVRSSKTTYVEKPIKTKYVEKPILYLFSSKVSIGDKNLARVEELREGFRAIAFDDTQYTTCSWKIDLNYYKSWSQFSQNLREQFLAKAVDYSTIKKTRPKREVDSEPTAWILENSRFVPTFDDVSDLEGTWFVCSKMKPTNEDVMNVLTKNGADWSSQIVKGVSIYMIPKRNEKIAKENENLRDVVEEAKINLLKSDSVQAIHTDLICELFGTDIADSLFKHQEEITDKVLVDFLNKGKYIKDGQWASLNGYKPGEHLKFYKKIFGKSYESPEVLYVQEKYKICSRFKSASGAAVLELVNFIGGVK